MKPEEIDAPTDGGGIDTRMYVTAHVPIEREASSEVAVRLRAEPTDGPPDATLFLRAGAERRFPVGSRWRLRCDQVA